MAQTMGVLAGVARIGVFRLFPKALMQGVVGDVAQLPPDWRTALLHFGVQPQTYATAQREAQEGEGNFAGANLPPGALGDLPFVILTADFWTKKPDAMKRAMFAMREEQVHLSTRGQHIIVPNCEHGSIVTLGRVAVVQAINEVVEAGRGRG
jgi:hypothetical protein